MLSLPLLPRWRRHTALLALLVLASGCALRTASPPTPPWPGVLQTLLPTDVLLLGEKHDAPQHQQLERQAVAWLAERGLLAALVIEMAEQGHDTRALASGADEAQVQTALAWDTNAWPWSAYGPVVMAAVRAGVPVLGGNLPRSTLRATLDQTPLDALLTPAQRARQQQAVRDGHCGLLPESRIPGMVRVQVARDLNMARTVASALHSGQVVLLVAGAGHVERGLGVPLHLPENIKQKVVIAHAGTAEPAIKNAAHLVQQTPSLPPDDACATLRERWQPAPAR
ncbi:ChaN family lipoprotein [Simplicispira piscis]